MSVSKSSSFPNLCFLHFLPSQWDEKAVDVFLPKSCNQASRAGSTFCVFSKVLDHPWSKLGRNQVLGKNGGSGFRCFCQDQYFQACSFINSVIYPGTFMREKEGCPLSADVNWQFTGWRGKRPGPGETSRRGRLVLCVLSVSWVPATWEWPACLCLVFI